jgi:hypothetical protein
MDATWRRSSGTTILTTGRVVPLYDDTTNLKIQVQALSGRDLKHVNYLGVQGVRRAVYMYGNVQGINRPNNQGGDLLIFPETPGGTPKVWLVSIVFETWPDWCRVGVSLQVPTFAITTEDGLIITTESGEALRTE